jgi:hypothetical protein
VTGAGDESVARELLAAARQLANDAGTEHRGTWPRAAALLARQALEVALKTFWSFTAAGMEAAPFKTQLLCLDGYIRPAVARQGYQTWSALSRACHHHVYELAPTRDELLAWCDDVESVVNETERAWV